MFFTASKFGFQLVRNDDNKQRDYIMLCRSIEEKQIWMQHVSLIYIYIYIKIHDIDNIDYGS